MTHCSTAGSGSPKCVPLVGPSGHSHVTRSSSVPHVGVLGAPLAGESPTATSMANAPSTLPTPQNAPATLPAPVTQLASSQLPPPMPPEAKDCPHFVVCDLGCGGGGSSLGAELAPHTRVAIGVDNRELPLRTFQRNHPEARAMHEDIHNVHVVAAAVTEAGCNVIIGSGPCQPHSTSTPANSKIDYEPLAKVTYSMVEVVEIVMPLLFIMENVEGLLKSRYGYWDKALKKLKLLGYNVSFAVIDACKLGVPQHRKRLIVIATLGASTDLPAAVAVLDSSADTSVHDVLPELGDCYWHYARDNHSSCVRSSHLPSPTLRTNSHHFPKAYVARTSDHGRPFEKVCKLSKRQLAAVMGWPLTARLPRRRSHAMKILGNSVPPPMMTWAITLARDALSAHAQNASVARTRLAAATSQYAAEFLTSADVALAHRQFGVSALDLQGLEIQRRLDEMDYNAAGAYLQPLPGSTDAQLLAHDLAVPDVDCNVTAVHLAQLQRRERLRTSVLLRAKTRSDGSTRSLLQPIWSAPQIGVPASSGNPTAMFGARPHVRVPDPNPVTHSSSRVSARWRNWQSQHITHCVRCQEFSQQRTGLAPPIAQILRSHETDTTPDSSLWMLDPTCYQLGMVADIREGFDPHISPAPAPVTVPNGPSCWDEWDETMAYMAKLDKLGCMSRGYWELPEDAVCSAMHVVARSSDLRKFKRDGTPYPVRTVLDLTKSLVNDSQEKWPFRLEGADAAVRLLGQTGHTFIGTCDISKFFPSFGLHPRAQKFAWIRDPRASTKWHGNGKPSKTWVAYQEARRKLGRRNGPYRRCTGMPLGMRSAPAFACSIAAEIVQLLTAMGIKCCQYVDDLLVSGATRAECQQNMDTAMSVLRWLGFDCNPDKTLGPAHSLKYIGYIFDALEGTIAIAPDRRDELIELLQAARDAQRIDTRDLETLIGKLGFTASVMRGGRAFLYRMRIAHRTAHRAELRHTDLGADPLADIDWWLRQLRGKWSGSVMFLSGKPLPTIRMKSDASGGGGPDAAHLGWGYQLGRAIHWSRWNPATVQDHHIQYKELVALAHACEEYGHLFANAVLRVGVDNSGVTYIANKLSSSCPTLMSLLRRIANAQCEHNFDLVCSHVSREFNQIADMLSRWQASEDLLQFLPSGVELPPGLQLAPSSPLARCRTASPDSSSPVYRALLQLQSRGEFSPTPARATHAKSKPSTPSAGAQAASPSTMCPASAPSCSTTLLASGKSRFTPTPRSPSSCPPGVTTPSSQESTSRTRAATTSYESANSSSPSPRSTRTCPPRTWPSHFVASATSPSPSASSRPRTSRRARDATLQSSPDCSSVTPPCCAAWSTSSARDSLTSTSSLTTSSWRLASATRRPSTSSGPDVSASRSATATSPLAPCFMFIYDVSSRPACAAVQMCRYSPLSPSTTVPRSQGGSGRTSESRWHRLHRPSASSESLGRPAYGLAAPPMLLPLAPQTSMCAPRGGGAATPTGATIDLPPSSGAGLAEALWSSSSVTLRPDVTPRSTDSASHWPRSEQIWGGSSSSDTDYTPSRTTSIASTTS